MLSEVNPPLYVLQDLMKDSVPGFYYATQLTKSPPPSDEDYFVVENILKQKIVKGEKYFLVKYLYYPSKFNQWVKESNVKFGEQ